MKRLFTIICAVVLSSASLSAQSIEEGVDIARFSIKVGYELQSGFWGSLDNTKANNVKLSIGYTF